MSVFALIARKLPPSQAELVFFLMFTLGFAVALLRSYCMLSANLVGKLRRTDRLRRIVSSAQSYGRLMPFAFLVFIVVFSFQSLPWWAWPIVAVIACAAGYDSDLTRAVVNRTPFYPWLMLAGNVISLLLLLTLNQAALGGVILAVLVVWIPPGLRGASRWWVERKLARSHRVRPWAMNRPVLMRPLLIASLEGIVLNTPFLGGAGSNGSGAGGYDLAIAIRVFASSQPLFPLIAHWSNSGKLWRLSRRLHISETTLYAILLLSTGMIASLLFVLLFGWISHHHVTGIQYGMFVVLLLGYCSYMSHARFYAMSLTARRVSLIYIVVPLLFLITLMLLRAHGASAWEVATLQGGSLFLAALAIRLLTRRPRPQGEVL